MDLPQFDDAEEYVYQERMKAIVASLNQCIQILGTFTLTQHPQVDSTENDVKMNVTATYRIT